MKWCLIPKNAKRGVYRDLREAKDLECARNKEMLRGEQEYECLELFSPCFEGPVWRAGGNNQTPITMKKDPRARFLSAFIDHVNHTSLQVSRQCSRIWH